jgi:hypothetical protein
MQLMGLKEKIKTHSNNYLKLQSLLKTPIDQCDCIEEFQLRSAHRDLRVACQV